MPPAPPAPPPSALLRREPPPPHLIFRVPPASHHHSLPRRKTAGAAADACPDQLMARGLLGRRPSSPEALEYFVPRSTSEFDLAASASSRTSLTAPLRGNGPEPHRPREKMVTFEDDPSRPNRMPEPRMDPPEGGGGVSPMTANPATSPGEREGASPGGGGGVEDVFV